jgi:hypothetical protein
LSVGGVALPMLGVKTSSKLEQSRARTELEGRASWIDAVV